MTSGAPAGLQLPLGYTHVWRVRTGRLEDDLRAVLSVDERRRADRFRRPEDRADFSATRGALRLLLAGYVKAEPGSIAFAEGSRGKPVLAASGAADVRFNVSHSEGLALLAFSLHADVGIDVERGRPSLDVDELVARFFTRRERERFAGLDRDERLPAFLRAWTRKEALVKASGAGLSMLEETEVPLDMPGAPAYDPVAFVTTVGECGLYDVRVGPVHVAALAVQGARGPVEMFDWAGTGTVVSMKLL